MTRWIGWIGAVLLVACTGPSANTVNLDVNDRKSAPADVQAEVRGPAEVVIPADQVIPEDTLDLVFDTDAAMGMDGGGSLCAAGEGCFLDPCAANEECLSGWCVGHMGENVCTNQCQSECPPGWSCQQIPGTAPDVVFICISDHANLCLPCATGAGCKGAAGADDVCVDYQDEGSFCGGACTSDDDCPWGFSCLTTVTVDGISTLQCVADAGVCPCTQKSVDLALWTPCEVSNEFGVCEGQRVCSEEGLSTCDAPEPQAEECNGFDDDCDGDMDEPGLFEGKLLELCDDDNACTDDACKGTDGCAHEPLTGIECVDGNPCTVADHCDAGECIGTTVDCDDNNPCTDDSCDETGGCFNTDNAVDCDDGDPCSVADECTDGACLGTPIACDCQSEADCDALEDGDLCNGTLVCDTSKMPFLCVVDPGTVVSCPEPAGADGPCLAAFCDPLTAGCSLVAANEGVACNDGNPCTVGDQCGDGACAPGVALNCADDNPCTDDSCDPTDGCLHLPNEQPCQDGDACTVGDGCVDGLCVPGQSLGCNDNNICTDDSCDALLGCLHQAAAGACDDGNACTVGEACAGGKCAGGSALACNDDNVCTTDSCAPESGCMHLLNQAPCNDGDVCTFGDHCQLGECSGGGSLECDDANPCTADACTSDSGCTFVPADGADCDDGNACTSGGTCLEGLCLGNGALDCDDDDPCTNDSCEPATGCTHSFNTAPCSDGNMCTLDDQCQNGACVPGAVLDCSDENVCTDDACVEGIGCQHSFNGNACDDKNACTGNDVCGNGNCAGASIVCDDDDVCTDDSCNPQTGCVHVHNAAGCDDGNACTTADTCAQGACVGGQPPDCNDQDPCTNDSCEPDSGCVHTPIVPCCGNGQVEAGEECDDGNQQSGDACDSQCQTAALTFLGYAVWQQQCQNQNDAQQDALMDQACHNSYNGRAATNPEFIEGQIIGVPANNNSGNHLIMKCPHCAGKTPYGAVEGHARACVNPGAGWPTAYFPQSEWNDHCCSSSRTTICVPK